MNKFMNFLGNWGEQIYEHQKESLKATYPIEGISVNETSEHMAAKSVKPVQKVTLHSNKVCNAEN